MKKIFYLIILIYTFSCNSQKKELKNSKTQTSSVFSKIDYITDIDELAKILTTTHPYPYQYISKKDFWKTIKKAKNQITDKTTLPEFIWYCSEIVANIGCSHTTLGAFLQESKLLPIKLMFPAELRLIDEKMYVTNPLINKGKLISGSEVISINGIKVEKLKQDIFKHISADGGKQRKSKKKYFNFFSPYYIAYALNFPKEYEIQLNDKKSAVKLEQLEEYEFTWMGKDGYSKEFCDDMLCFEIIEDKNLAVLTMRSFFYKGDDLDNYRKLIEKSFKKIKEKKISNLIIDLRGNGGGQSFNAAFLLRYLVSTPFTFFIKGTPTAEESMNPMNPFENAFSGTSYILQDAGCGSSTGFFLSLVKYNKLGTIIGEESGGTYLCNDGSRILKLKNTSISCRIARVTFTTTAKDLPRNKGILPDHFVIQGIQDYVNNIDTVLKYTLELIENK